MVVSTDTGGTFTDAVDDRGRTTKVLSDREDPARAVARAVDELVGGRPELLAHGTTVPTNALLERRGARVALVTNHGLADVIEIGRQDRPSLYDPFVDRPEPLVARADRLEVAGRLDATGGEVVPIGVVPTLPPGVEAVAVCLLHADLNSAHEAAVAAGLEAAGLDVSRSSSVSPEFREYERAVTTVINAYLRPTCRAYLRRLSDLADEVLVLSSAGGLLPADTAAELPAALLVSGPAGGARAAAAAAVTNGFPDAVTFDMGGTSTDVCLVVGGRPEPAAGRSVAGFPVRFPSLDIHTIGAGGGSIAHIDPGGALLVGPQSAGANPGPACYGRDGREATVTDANLVAGRIPADDVFPDLGRLDVDAARRALDRAGVTAAGVLAVVNANMERALRTATVEQGVDPRSLALVAFGGAGPLHACELADALGMGTVVVPARAGVLSAVGILGAPRQREVVRSWSGASDRRRLADLRTELEREAIALVGSGASAESYFDCRYRGQSHELRVRELDEFSAEHQRRNGYAVAGGEVEVVAVRAVARGGAPHAIAGLPTLERTGASGPAVLAEPDCTIFVPDGWTARPGEAGALVITRGSR
jgi:N-methylhydantoinase A/oxoprolinase/acetone carboxylase beta subunit